MSCGRRGGVGLFISFAENTINAGEWNILTEMFKNVVDRIYVSKCHNQGGKMLDEYYRQDNEHIAYLNNIEDGIGPLNKNRSICPMPFIQIQVTAECFLTACCYDFNKELIVADLNKVSLKEAWNNENMRKLRLLHLNNVLPECSMCYNCLNNKNNTVEPLLSWIS